MTFTRASNHRFAEPTFVRRFGRAPVPSRDRAATINDVIFERMIDPRWSARERILVDKELAKIEACRRAPALRAPETLMIAPMDRIGSADDLFAVLRPFAGTRTIAKPTHASGAATFLRGLASVEDVRWLHEVASRDYATVVREMQYLGLPRKIIVETLIPTARDASPDDYKFHCVHGEPILCQIDHARFGAAWSRLFRVPDFTPMHEDDGLTAPDSFALAAPDRIATMISAARELAAGFDFVRVDLYDGADGVYFGEVTFTPAAALGIAPSSAGDLPDSDTHRVYSATMMAALRAARERVPVKAEAEC